MYSVWAAEYFLGEKACLVFKEKAYLDRIEQEKDRIEKEKKEKEEKDKIEKNQVNYNYTAHVISYFIMVQVF